MLMVADPWWRVRSVAVGGASVQQCSDRRDIVGDIN
jgi:hypothetical protein